MFADNAITDRIVEGLLTAYANFPSVETRRTAAEAVLVW